MLVMKCPAHETPLRTTMNVDIHADWQERLKAIQERLAREAKKSEVAETPPLVRGIIPRMDEFGRWWVDSRDMIRADCRVPVEFDGFVFEIPGATGRRMFEVVGWNDDAREYLIRPMLLDPEHVDIESWRAQ
jgi:hypothetical protein